MDPILYNTGSLPYFWYLIVPGEAINGDYIANVCEKWGRRWFGGILGLHPYWRRAWRDGRAWTLLVVVVHFEE